MSEIKRFNDEVSEKLKYYVYRLIDPRDGQTFYVGKGKGNRVFAHINCALRNFDNENYEEENDDYISLKTKRIIEIKKSGLEVLHIIHRWGLTHEQALIVESALIDCYNTLYNIKSGYAADYGVTNATVLARKLSTEVYDEPDDIDYMIIKTTESQIEICEGDIYQATRSRWKININKAKKYKYVLSVIGGIVRAVYEVDDWKESEGRCEFFGHPAPKDVLNKFINKHIPKKYTQKGMANPVLYKK